jgi:hypothetical protein
MAAIYVHLMDPGVTKVLGIASAELPELSDVFTGIAKLARSDRNDSW